MVVVMILRAAFLGFKMNKRGLDLYVLVPPRNDAGPRRIFESESRTLVPAKKARIVLPKPALLQYRLVPNREFQCQAAPIQWR